MLFNTTFKVAHLLLVMLVTLEIPNNNYLRQRNLIELMFSYSTFQTFLNLFPSLFL